MRYSFQPNRSFQETMLDKKISLRFEEGFTRALLSALYADGSPFFVLSAEAAFVSTVCACNEVKLKIDMIIKTVRIKISPNEGYFC